MEVIYIVPESTVGVPENPLLPFLQLEEDELVVIHGELSDSEIDDQVKEVIRRLPRGEKVVIILSAFMNPSQEGVVDGNLNPPEGRLPFLRGRQLLWFLWNRHGSRILLLVSLDDIKMKSDLRTSMSVAFSEDNVCTFIYPRGSPDDWFESLANSVYFRTKVTAMSATKANRARR